MYKPDPLKRLANRHLLESHIARSLVYTRSGHDPNHPITRIYQGNELRIALLESS